MSGRIAGWLVIGAAAFLILLDSGNVAVTNKPIAKGQQVGPQTGPKGATGAAGATGPAGPSAVGAPNVRTVAFATDYQATDTTKPANISVLISCTASVALGSPATNTVELHFGATSVAGGGGTTGDVYSSSLSVSIIISIGWTGQAILKSQIPAGYHFAVLRTSGTGCTVTSAFDQSLG